MLGLTKEKIRSLKPLYNVDIKLTGFQGPFNSLVDFEVIGKLVSRLRDLQGKFYILENGELVSGKKERIHTFYCELDVSVIGRLPYIHYPNGQLSYITRIKGKPFLEEGVMDYKTRFEHGIEPRNPMYTLKGLYNTIENDRLNTKINALTDALKEHVKYDFQTIAKRKRTKICLLENAYKRLVSNQ